MFLKRAVVVRANVRIRRGQKLLLSPKLRGRRRAVSLVSVRERKRDLQPGDGGVRSGACVWKLRPLIAIYKVQVRAGGNLFELCLGLCLRDGRRRDTHFGAPS